MGHAPGVGAPVVDGQVEGHSLVGGSPATGAPSGSRRLSRSGSSQPSETPVGVSRKPSSRRALRLPEVPGARPRWWSERPSATSGGGPRPPGSAGSRPRPGPRPSSRARASVEEVGAAEVARLEGQGQRTASPGCSAVVQGTPGAMVGPTARRRRPRAAVTAPAVSPPATISRRAPAATASPGQAAEGGLRRGGRPRPGPAPPGRPPPGRARPWRRRAPAGGRGAAASRGLQPGPGRRAAATGSTSRRARSRAGGERGHLGPGGRRTAAGHDHRRAAHGGRGGAAAAAALEAERPGEAAGQARAAHAQGQAAVDGRPPERVEVDVVGGVGDDVARPHGARASSPRRASTAAAPAPHVAQVEEPDRAAALAAEHGHQVGVGHRRERMVAHATTGRAARRPRTGARRRPSDRWPGRRGRPG